MTTNPAAGAPHEISLATTPLERLQILEDTIRESSDELRAVAAWISRSVPRKLQPFVALRWAQSRGYHPDHQGVEEIQSIQWTIDHGGDCEDLSALVVTLFRLLGYDAEIIWITQKGHDLNHVTAVVLLDGGPSKGGSWIDEGRGSWADASISGALLGENPYTAARRTRKQHVLGG